MLLSVLIACKCPEFGDMYVQGHADDGFLRRIEEALYEFADWTGREGVCVTGIEVEEEVWVAGEEVDGSYHGPHREIQISASPGHTDRVVRHELCHALDEQEGHSVQNPAIFTGDDVQNDTLYPTPAAKREESFAVACSNGASGVELILAIDELCGGSRWGKEYAYTQEFVYTAFPRNPVVDSLLEVQQSSRLLEVGVETSVIDAVGYDGSLLLLVEWTHEADSWGLVLVDPATGRQISALRLGDGQASSVGAQLVRSDGPILVLIGWEDGEHDLLEVDLLNSSSMVMAEGLNIPRLASSAWSEDVLYVTGQWEDGSPLTVAWSTGEVVELQAPAPGYAIAPVPGGYEAFTEVGFLRYLDGAWSILSGAKAGGPDVVPVDEEWRLATSYGAVGDVWTVVHAETGEYGLLGQCQTFERHSTAWIASGDEIFAIEAGPADDTGRVPVTVLSMR